jgi:hypothetical protein
MYIYRYMHKYINMDIARDSTGIWKTQTPRSWLRHLAALLLGAFDPHACEGGGVIWHQLIQRLETSQVCMPSFDLQAAGADHVGCA